MSLHFIHPFFHKSQPLVPATLAKLFHLHVALLIVSTICHALFAPFTHHLAPALLRLVWWNALQPSLITLCHISNLVNVMWYRLAAKHVDEGGAAAPPPPTGSTPAGHDDGLGPILPDFGSLLHADKPDVRRSVSLPLCHSGLNCGNTQPCRQPLRLAL